MVTYVHYYITDNQMFSNDFMYMVSLSDRYSPFIPSFKLKQISLQKPLQALRVKECYRSCISADCWSSVYNYWLCYLSEYPNMSGHYKYISLSSLALATNFVCIISATRLSLSAGQQGHLWTIGFFSLHLCQTINHFVDGQLTGIRNAAEYNNTML